MIKILNLQVFFKQILSFFPVCFVDAIFNSWCLDLSLYQTSVFQFFKMLGKGGFGDGKFIGQITAVTAALI